MKTKLQEYEEKNEDYINEMLSNYKLDPHLLALGLVKPFSKVLSCGCGAGRETKYLSEVLCCDVVGIDSSDKMVYLANTYAIKAKHRIADIRYYLLPRNEKVEYITCLWNTINFLGTLEDKKLFIRSCMVNLKDGGKIIIESATIFGYWRRLLHNIYHKDNFYFSKYQINSWFKGLPFKIEKIKVDKNIIIVATKEVSI